MAAANPSTLLPASSPLTQDILLELPELEGATLRPGTSVELSALDSSKPLLTLGSKVTFSGHYEYVFGTAVAVGSSASSVTAVAGMASKKIVFQRESGVLSDILVQKAHKPGEG